MYRTEVDQVAVPLKVGGIADDMFPIAPLPYAFFGTSDLRVGAVEWHRAGPGEPGFQHRDTGRKGIILRRQGPQRVDCCGQDRDGLNRERVPGERLPHCAAQKIDLAQKKVIGALCQTEGKEISCAGHPAADVVGHTKRLGGLRLSVR